MFRFLCLSLLVAAPVAAAAAERPFALLDDASSYLVMDNQSAAVRTEDGLVFTAGITGMDPKTRRFVSDDPARQMAAAMDNLEAVLKAAGATLGDVVQVTFWAASLADYRAANPVYVQRMGGHRPARSVMGFVPWDPRFRVQIQAVAKVRPHRSSPPSPAPPAPTERTPAMFPSPPGTGWQAPARAAQIAGCREPVLMLVMGALSEQGFRKPEGAPRSYGEALRDSNLYANLDGFYLLSGRPLEVFEGDWTARDMALVAEFPCLEAARAFYWSKAYQDIIPLRAGAGDFFLGVWRKRTRDEMGRPFDATPAAPVRTAPAQ
jgi:2-iminobutanoate/2-iminopropanoate deaminase